MDENQMQEQMQHEEVPRESFGSKASLWGAAAVTLVLALVVWGISYGYHQGAVIKRLESNQAALNATTEEMHSQLNTLASKLADVSAAQNAAAEATEAANSPAAKRATAQRARRPTQSAGNRFSPGWKNSSSS